MPPGLSEKSREIVMSYLNSGLEQDKVIQTLIFKDLGVNSTKELEVEKKFLQNSHFLTIFVHRKGATNEILKILGENCPSLQVIISSKFSCIYIIKSGVCLSVCQHYNVPTLTSPSVFKLLDSQGYLWLPYDLADVIKLFG